MESYSVKQIAEMLNTQPETVRRWIRNGKLSAKKASRKEGHVVSEEDLQKFLNNSPKYAGFAAGIIGSALTMPIAAIPLAGGIAATYLAAARKARETGDEKFSKEEVRGYLKEEIERRSQSVNQKMMTIKQLQREIATDQQQISECTYVLSQLDKDD